MFEQKNINDFSTHLKLWKIYSFAAVHCKIRSLQGNLENFVHVLSELQFSLSVIGLSEINFKVNKGITNVNISDFVILFHN